MVSIRGLDMANNDDSIQDGERREFILNTTTAVVAGAGVAAACIPFVASMNPSADVLLKANSEVSIKGMKPGELKTIAWQGKPIFVLRRTAEQISKMQSDDGNGKDPQADSERVTNPDWLIVIGLCTHLGCVPSRKPSGWFCPCHGSEYDNSGRILQGPAPRNLDLPPYKFLADSKLLIGNEVS